MDAEVVIKTAHHEEAIHVGGNDLRLRIATGCTAYESRSPFKDAFDGGRVIGPRCLIEPDPIPHRGEVALVAQLARQPGQPYGRARPNLGSTAMFSGDARRHQMPGPVEAP